MGGSLAMKQSFSYPFLREPESSEIGAPRPEDIPMTNLPFGSSGYLSLLRLIYQNVRWQDFNMTLVSPYDAR